MQSKHTSTQAHKHTSTQTCKHLALHAYTTVQALSLPEAATPKQRVVTPQSQIINKGTPSQSHLPSLNETVPVTHSQVTHTPK
jgi:hypothetical protein